MAPARRRNRKPNMRIDAAYAAMRVLGFADKDVKKCVEKLLEVYGEEDVGWYFIEENSYKLLIETLIDGDGDSEPLPAITGGDGACSSRGSPSSLPLLCDQTAVKYEEDDVDDGKTVVSLADIYDKCNAKESGSWPQDKSVQALPKPPHYESPPPMKKMRKPCYGWISDDDSGDDDEDDDKFITLPPENEDN